MRKTWIVAEKDVSILLGTPFQAADMENVMGGPVTDRIIPFTLFETNPDLCIFLPRRKKELQ